MTREREYFFGEDRMRGGFGGRGGRGPGGPGGFVHKSQIVKALKETMQSGHRTGLPPKILDYFTPRPPMKLGTEIKKKKKKVPFTGVAAYVHMFAGPQDPEEIKEPSNKLRLYKNPELQLQCRLDTETKAEKEIRLAEWKKEEAAKSAAEAAKSWDPHKDSKAESDPYRTLFVARLSYDVNEKQLRKEFEEFGPIKQVRIVTDKNGKSRGYAFVEFEDKKDMKEAYKAADGKKIEGRRVRVDVERGRLVESWKPRRLGGGLGGEGREPRPPKPKNAKGGVPGLPPPVIMENRGPPRERSPMRGPPPMDRERFDRGPPPMDRDRFDRGPPPMDRDRFDRGPPPMDRDRRDRERMDIDRDRERKRDRDSSPRRDRGDDYKRRREVEDGEVRGERGERGDRGRERSPDRRRR